MAKKEFIEERTTEEVRELREHETVIQEFRKEVMKNIIKNMAIGVGIGVATGLVIAFAWASGRGEDDKYDETEEVIYEESYEE